MGNLLVIQGRVLGALIIRESRATFGKTQFGYLWEVMTPVAMIAVLVTVFAFAGRAAPFGTSLALFFATGLFTLQLFNKLSNSLMGALKANKALLTYPPIKETDVVVARFLLISATYVVIMTVFFGGLIWFGQAELPIYVHDVMLAFCATALVGLGFGLTNMVIVTRWENWSYVEKIMTRPLLFLSGIFYVPSTMPSEAIAIIWWNPVLHCVEWFRTGYYPNYESAVLDKNYLLAVSALLLLFGLAGERFTRRGRG